MTRYSKKLKSSIIAKMLAPNNIPVSELSRETNIPEVTLYNWRKQALKNNYAASHNGNDRFTSQDKFNIVLETAALNELDFGKYCRSKGLFPQHVKDWKKVQMNAHEPQPSRAELAKSRATSKDMRKLEAEILRKDKALAEAAALLLLQKKVDTLLRGPEDD